MNCPVCNTVGLRKALLEEDLPCSDCISCGGHWVNSFEFWNWLAKHPAPEGVEPPVASPKPLSQEIKGARICPECAHILSRFKVGVGFDFTIDRCGHCGGIWFDENEWEFLKSRGLHCEAHHVFSSEWQNRVRKEETAMNLVALFRQRIGISDFERARQVKVWLDIHPRRSEILSYLNDTTGSNQEST